MPAFHAAGAQVRDNLIHTTYFDGSRTEAAAQRRYGQSSFNQFLNAFSRPPLATGIPGRPHQRPHWAQQGLWKSKCGMNGIQSSLNISRIDAEISLLIGLSTVRIYISLSLQTRRNCCTRASEVGDCRRHRRRPAPCQPSLASSPAARHAGVQVSGSAAVSFTGLLLCQCSSRDESHGPDPAGQQLQLPVDATPAWQDSSSSSLWSVSQPGRLSGWLPPTHLEKHVDLGGGLLDGLFHGNGHTLHQLGQLHLLLLPHHHEPELVAQTAPAHPGTASIGQEGASKGI